MSLSLTDAGQSVYDLIKEDPLGKGGLAKDVIEYFELIRDFSDPDKRYGVALELGVKATAAIVTKALGERAFSANYFFKYHEQHFKLLIDAVAALEKRKDATASFMHAVKRADNLKIVDDRIKQYRDMVLKMQFNYIGLIEAMKWRLEIKAGARTEKTAKDMADAGMTDADLVETEKDFRRLRANWVGLYFDSLEFYAMMRVEVKMIQKSMDEFNRLIRVLSKGSSVEKVTGLATENDVEWAKYDRAVKPVTTAPEYSMINPVKAAEDQRDRIDVTAFGIGLCCKDLLALDFKNYEVHVGLLSARLDHGGAVFY